jgi:hypothetical protein
MSLLTYWPRRRTTNQSPERQPSHRRPDRFRPHLEALDDRWVPAQVSLTVTSLADAGAGTLRDAILTADAGKQSDKFAIGFTVTGTIDLQSPLPNLNNTIAIQGPGASSLTVERAAGASFPSAMVRVGVGQTAGLSGMTIANSDTGGISNTGSLTITDCTISGNSVDFSYGGGIFNNFSGTLAVIDSTLSGNSAFNGGGIWSDGTLTVSGSTLSNNSAEFGGAVSNYGGTLTISGSILSRNTAFTDRCAKD